MGFIDKVRGDKRATIDRLEAGRVDTLVRKLAELGAEVDRNGIVLYSADRYHGKDAVTIEMPSTYKCLPEGIEEAEVRVPVVLVDGLLFAACEFRIAERTWNGHDYRSGGIGVFLVRYSPCSMRMKVEDEHPLTTTVDLAKRLEGIVGKAFGCKHSVRYQDRYYDWRDLKDVTVYHDFQIEDLPPTTRPAGFVATDHERPSTRPASAPPPAPPTPSTLPTTRPKRAKKEA